MYPSSAATTLAVQLFHHARQECRSRRGRASVGRGGGQRHGLIGQGRGHRGAGLDAAAGGRGCGSQPSEVQRRGACPRASSRGYSLSLTVSNNTRTTRREATSSIVVNSLDRIHQLLNSQKTNDKAGMIITYKRYVITHVRSKVMTTNGGPKPNNLKAESSIMCPGDVVL